MHWVNKFLAFISFLIILFLLICCDVFVKKNEDDFNILYDQKEFDLQWLIYPQNSSKAVISPNGKFIYSTWLNTSYSDLYSYIIDPKAGNNLYNERIYAHPNNVQDINISPDGKFLYFAMNSLLYYYQIEIFQGGLEPYVVLDLTADNFCISPDGKNIYLYYSGGTITCCNRSFATGQVSSISQISYSGNSPYDYTFTPDSRFLYVADGSSLLCYKRNTQSGTLTYQYTNTHIAFYKISISPDGKNLYGVDGATETVGIYNIDNANGNLININILFLNNFSSIYVVNISPDGNAVIVGGYSSGEGCDYAAYLKRDSTTGNLITDNTFNFRLDSSRTCEDFVFQPGQDYAYIITTQPM